MLYCEACAPEFDSEFYPVESHGGRSSLRDNRDHELKDGILKDWDVLRLRWPDGEDTLESIFVDESGCAYVRADYRGVPVQVPIKGVSASRNLGPWGWKEDSP